MRSQKPILCNQENTHLRFATRPSNCGLKMVDRNQTGNTTLGLKMYATQEVNGNGLLFGVTRGSIDTHWKASTKKHLTQHGIKTQRSKTLTTTFNWPARPTVRSDQSVPVIAMAT